MSVRRVQAHTNAVGEHSLRHWAPRNYVTPTGRRYESGSWVDIAYSYKSPTVKGNIVNGFKRPTNYSRCIVKADPGVLGARENTSLGTLRYVWDGECHQVGFSWSIPFWSSSAKRVQLPMGLEEGAINDARAKIANMRISVGVALGEAKTTIAMIAQSMDRLVRAYRALFRSKNPHEAYRILYGKHRRYRHSHTKTAANLWLEWFYGWYPLLMDIWGGVETLRNGFRTKEQIFSVTSMRSQEFSGEKLTLSPVAARSNTRSESNNDVVRASSKVKLWGRVLFSEFHVAASLGVNNPASVAWELVPYSFVIDWLIPIGEWLEALSATSGTSFVAGCVTNVVEGRAWYKDLTPGVSSDPSRYPSNNSNFTVEVLAMTRTQLFSWPIPSIYLRDPLSVHHLTTTLALLRQTKLR